MSWRQYEFSGDMAADPNRDRLLCRMKVISLGWGVQSWTLAAMVALGELPPVDAAVHADTLNERSETYAFARRWRPWLKSHGVKVITVSDKKAVRSLETKRGQVHLPAFTLNTEGSKGQLRRSCTQRWKIAPQRRWISAELQRRGLKKEPRIVEQWFGITKDEWIRAKDSDVKYIVNRYPFLEMDPLMSRLDVMNWLEAHGLEIPVKSACVFCPYRSKRGWRSVRDGVNGDWQRALDIDRLIRHKRPGYECFVCDQRLPLDECDFRTPQEQGQLAFWETETDECSGYCFL